MPNNSAGKKLPNKLWQFIDKLLSNKLIFGISLLVVILALTLPGYKALRHPGMIYSHDGEGHVVKVIEFDQALNDGMFPVRWAKKLNYGLGYPIFAFSYPMSYFLYDLSHISLGLSYIDALKFTLFLSFPLSGLFAFFWLRQLFRNSVSLLGSMVYTYVPYHFVNVYVRAALGEVIAATLIPLCFYLLEKWIQKMSIFRTGLLALSLALLPNAHNVTALIFYPILLAYGILRLWQTDKRAMLKHLIWLGVGYVWAIIISAFYLIPATLYQKNTQLENLKNYFPTHDNWPTLMSLINSPWGYGPSKASDGMSFQIGIFHLVFFVLALITLVLVWKKRTRLEALAIFFIVIFLGSIFFMQPISTPVWNLLSSLEYSQFPWRFLLVPTVACTFFTAYVVTIWQRKLTKPLYFYGVLVILFGILTFPQHTFWHVFQFYQFDQTKYVSEAIPETRAYLNEHLPKWHDSGNEQLPYIQSEVIEGTATLSNQTWNANYHRFEVDATESAVIADRTEYFPGWNVYTNGQKQKVIDPYNPQSTGLLAFSVPAGHTLVESKFEETNLEKVSDLLSLIGLVAIVIAFAMECFSKPTSSKKV